MRHVAVWAMLAGCAAQAADGEVVVGEEGGPRLVQTLAEYDCEIPALGGAIRAEVEIAADVMMTAEVCGEIGDPAEVGCEVPSTTMRYDDRLTVMCDTTQASFTGQRFVRIWTLTEEAAE